MGSLIKTSDSVLEIGWSPLLVEHIQEILRDVLSFEAVKVTE